MRTPADRRGVKDRADIRKLVLSIIQVSPIFCGHSLWVMPNNKL